ncbi:MAG: rubrerythrin family protein [Candidatus Aminicenantaceae bacterium]
MKQKSEENLKNAFAGESQAHLKYLAFADKAERENYPNIARLFRANSFAEQVHATNHLRTLSEIGKTSENVQTAIDGETYEVTEMYPEFIREAEEEQEKGAETVTKWALEAEKVHAELYKKAKEGLEEGNDLEFKPVHVCQVCGFTVEGEAPDICPLCGSPKEKFRRF